MAVFIDQLNRKIELSSTPKRIISLVPSQTELLYDLGLREEVVGITKFCVHPADWYKSKTRVGGTKKINFDIINQLQPDLIIGNKEENEQTFIEELMKRYNVWMSDIYTLKDAYDMITRIGTIVGKQKEATFLKLEIESKFNSFINNNEILKTKKIKCAYFIWRKPYMVAGNNTFINNMLDLCSFENVFTNFESRYPEVSEEIISKTNPELILLSSEPFPFKEKHVEELKNYCPNATIKIVDGEIFSWYGSRLLKAPEYFTELLQSIKTA